MTVKEKLYGRISELENTMQTLWYSQSVSQFVKELVQKELYKMREDLIDLEHEHNMDLIETDRKYGELWD